jgi:hypothetical protein
VNMSITRRIKPYITPAAAPALVPGPLRQGHGNAPTYRTY